MDLLTAKAVAARLGVSPLTVLRLSASGKLPAVIVTKGAHRRILRWRVEMLEAFIASHEQRPLSDAGLGHE